MKILGLGHYSRTGKDTLARLVCEQNKASYARQNEDRYAVVYERPDAAVVPGQYQTYAQPPT